MRLKYHIILSLLWVGVAVAQSNLWQRMTAPYGADIFGITVDGAGWIFATTDCGLYRSSNHVDNWALCPLGFSMEHLDGIFATSWGDLYLSDVDGHLARSIDHGNSWHTIDTSVYDSIYGSNSRVLGAPQNMMLSTARGVFICGYFRSIDSGKTWSPIHYPPNTTVQCLASNGQGDLFLGTFHSGVYRSMDDGNTWVSTSNGIDSNGYFGPLINSISVSRNGTIFAGAGPTGLYRSTDNGDHWRRTGPPVTDSAMVVTTFIDRNDYLYISLVISGFTWKNYPNVATGGCFRSTDLGKTWTRSTNGLYYHNIVNLALDSSGVLYGGAGSDIGMGDNGIYRSTDQGITWHEANVGISCLKVYSVIAKSDGNLFFGTLRGIYRSNDNGVSWQHADTSLIRVPEPSSMTCDKNGYLYTQSTPNDKIIVSTDNGNHWAAFTDSLPGRPSVGDLKGQVMDFSDSSGHIFIGTNVGVYRSVDTGKSWQQMNGGYPYNDVWNLVVSRTGNIIANTPYALAISTDDGKNWRPIVSWGNARNIGTCTVKGQDGNIYVGTDQAGVLVSTDGGYSWYWLSNDGLPKSEVSGYLYPSSIMALAANSHGDVFVAVENNDTLGIYRLAAENHTSWEIYQGNLLSNYYGWIQTIGISADGYLFVALSNGGVYRTTQSTLGIHNPITDALPSFHLFQNYPNPFNPTTDIGYRIADLGLVTLKIYNILGQEVVTLVNEIKPPGTYNVKWDAGNNPTGVYFYQLHAGSFHDVKKLVITR